MVWTAGKYPRASANCSVPCSRERWSPISSASISSSNSEGSTMAPTPAASSARAVGTSPLRGAAEATMGERSASPR